MSMTLDIETQAQLIRDLEVYIEDLKQFLSDIGIDPELAYTYIDREQMRDALAGVQVPGVRA